LYIHIEITIFIGWRTIWLFSSKTIAYYYKNDDGVHT
jgi:hypothetical protein